MATPKTNRIANAQSAMAAVQTALFPFSFFLWVLALCLGASTVNASVTFTVSPNTVSNAYNGLVTLQINGLTNGVTNVVVQKFLDVNSNSVIDSGDLLVQQFRLSVGQTNVFMDGTTPVTVTNFMPSDTSPVTNQMTIPLNFQNGDFAQNLVGHYLYKVSSQTNSFTNLFIVTNSFFPCVITGAVENAASTNNITNAIVLLCLNQSGPIVVQAGAVANSSGIFSLRAPPGNYVVAAARSNFVDDISQSGITLFANTTTNGSIALTPATTNITGRVFNSANSNGLAGVSGTLISTNNQFLSFYFTDTNGYFYGPVTSNFWQAPLDEFSVAFQGCLTSQSNQWLNVSNKSINLTYSLPPANAIFYGVVSNASAVPMPGVYVAATNNAGYQTIGMTDRNGKYVVGVSSGADTNVWLLSVVWPDNPGLTNNAYVFGPAFLQTNGLQSFQAVRQDFSILTAPYTISGLVQDYSGQPVVDVEVFATNGIYQAINAVTASDGTYSLNVAPGTWTVGVDSNSLAGLGYTNGVPPNQTEVISDSGVANVDFLIEVCSEIDISTTNLPNAIVGEPYDAEIQALSCHGISSWGPAYGITLTSLYDTTNLTYTNGTVIYVDAQRVGNLETEFGVTNAYDSTNKLDEPYFINCSGTAKQVGSGWQFDNVSATVNVTGPVTNGTTVTINSVNWTVTADATPNGSNYTITIANGALPSSSGDYYLDQGMIDGVGTTISKSGSGSNRVASVLGAFHSISAFGNSRVAASSIPYTNQDNTVVFIEQGGHVGQYMVSAFGPQSTNLPPGLGLYPDGSDTATLAGTPASTGTNGGNFNFSIMAEDANSNVTVQALSMFVFPASSLIAPSSAQAGGLESSNTFQMQLTGLTTNLNYTVLMTTNLTSTNWQPIFTANNPVTNSIFVPDTTATDATRFYRLQISQ
jgi:hypothetical protein